MPKHFYSIITLILFIILAGCNQKQQAQENIPMPPVPRKPFPYKIEAYTKKYKLPKELEEISGISDLGNGLMACVQDEKGKVYVYSLVDEAIQKEIRFAKNGDFEDVSVAGNTVYSLRSDGMIYQIDDFDGANQVTELETPLRASNDTEGMCYHSASNSLWIACKAASGINEHVKGTRAIYAFHLANKSLSANPIITIDLEHLSALAGNRVPFEPSGIAIHPVTGNTYIISSVGRVLIVLDSQGEVIHMQSLQQKGFKQPEGICFTANGDMYISNEGRGGKANILYFKYLK